MSIRDELAQLVAEIEADERSYVMLPVGTDPLIVEELVQLFGAENVHFFNGLPALSDTDPETEAGLEAFKRTSEKFSNTLEKLADGPDDSLGT